MKVSKMIKNLQEFIDEYGDIECYYASDEECNELYPVLATPSWWFIGVNGDIISEEDMKELDYSWDDYEDVCVVN